MDITLFLVILPVLLMSVVVLYTFHRIHIPPVVGFLVAGVLLDELAPRSRLAREGLEPGDVITGVARQRVRSLSDFREAVEDSRGSILLQIERRGRTYIARID